jgi:2-polyprenyl-3-methyl-5-hydroxy-6-metoxy-1,4-benzoquinol methylase
MDNKETNKIIEDGYNQIAELYSARRFSKKELVYNFFDSISEFFPKQGKVLDLGCGSGVPVSSYFAEKGFDITGVDISYKMIELVKRNIPKGNFHVSDMLECNFSNEEFDIIISTFAIIHVPQDKQVILFEKIFNWLKKDGVCFLVLGSSNEKEIIDNNWHGVKMFWSHFNSEEYKTMLTKTGFKILWEEIEEIPNDATFYNIILKR